MTSPKVTNEYEVIPKEKFAFVQLDKKLRDVEFKTKPVGYFQDVMRRFARNKGSVVCAVILLILILYAILAPALSVYHGCIQDPYYSYALPRLSPRNAPGFWNGCSTQDINQQSYDYYSGIPGAVVELKETYEQEAAGRTQTMYIGALEGYYGGTFDLLMERFKDIFYEIPFMVFMTLCQMYLAKKLGSLFAMFIAFVLFDWIGPSSTVRAQFYRFKGQEYVMAARTLGARDSRLIFRHILPNASGFIITASVLSIPSIILSEATLSYLGIVNLQSSTLTSVGAMLENGQSTLSTYPHSLFFPATFLAILLICFNMADKVAVMYAGKIVEYGAAEDVFYSPAHPYTWALLASMPDLDTKEKLEAIPGTPPNMIHPPEGDAFAERNRYAMQIDFERQPPQFRISNTHWAATWLLHPDAPKVDPPKAVTDRIRRMKELEAASDGNR